MAGVERVRKLKWLCRRGMKELDILLERFVKENEASLGNGSWPEFEAMLATEDDVLWDWFQNPAESDAEYSRLLMTISRGSG
ncbi:succinate dehydrogenase assembly factor 2 [Pseudomonadota bacterium]